MERIAWLNTEILSEDERRHALAHDTGVPFITLERHEIQPEALLFIPEPLSRSRNIVAYRLEGNSLEVALLDIADLEALVPLALPHKILPRLTTRESLTRALLQYQKVLKEKFSEGLMLGMHAVDGLVRHALLSRAGVVHLEPSLTGTLVRYRIAGALHEALRLPEQVGGFLMERLRALAGLLPAATPQEGRFKVEKDGEVVSVRVRTHPLAGERTKMSLHLTRGSTGALGYSLESLGLHGAALEALHGTLHSRHGALVVALGREGSGKTTLLYTLLDELSAAHLALASVERQVEHRLPRVAQMQADGVRITLAGGVRAALRGDPDVLMIGEVQDGEVLELAAQAAARGVLVLVGMEDESLLDGGLPAGRQASLVVRTALARRLCPEYERGSLSREEMDAVEQYASPAKVLAALKEEGVADPLAQWKDLQFGRHHTNHVGVVARAEPCNDCEGGYKGGIGLYEVSAPGWDCLNLIEDALFKSAQGLVSVEDILEML